MVKSLLGHNFYPETIYNCISTRRNILRNRNVLMKQLYNNETTGCILWSHVHFDTRHQYDIKGEKVVNILTSFSERSPSINFVKFHSTHNRISF
jgi:hypothetical protein